VKRTLTQTEETEELARKRARLGFRGSKTEEILEELDRVTVLYLSEREKVNALNFEKLGAEIQAYEEKMGANKLRKTVLELQEKLREIEGRKLLQFNRRRVITRLHTPKL